MYHCYRLSYQCVCLELGYQQWYQLKPVHEEDAIQLSVARKHIFNAEQVLEADNDVVKLVSSVHQFINESVDQNMTADFKKFSVDCYLPCVECGKLHIKYEKAFKSNEVLCEDMDSICDISEYHKILSNAGKPGQTSIYNLLTILSLI